MKSTKLERSRMRRKVSRTVLQSSEEGRPSSLRQQYAEETTEEDLKKIAAEAPVIKLAYDELDRFRWNEKDLIAYEERILSVQKEKAILAQKLDDATQKGILIGHEKGRKERNIEVAKNLLKAGVSIDIISQTTGLSLKLKLHNSRKKYPDITAIFVIGCPLLDHSNGFQVCCLFFLATDSLTD